MGQASGLPCPQARRASEGKVRLARELCAGVVKPVAVAKSATASIHRTAMGLACFFRGDACTRRGLPPLPRSSSTTLGIRLALNSVTFVGVQPQPGSATSSGAPGRRWGGAGGDV